MYSSSVQSLSCVWLFATPWTAAHQASLSITKSRSLFKLLSIESVMPYNHLILCHPLLLLPPIPLSIRVFSNESTLRIRWPKYWSFSFNISPSNERPGLISFRVDWLHHLQSKGLSRVFSNTTVQKHQFFCTQLSLWSNSHIHTWQWKTIALTRWTSVGKVMSLLSNMLSRFVIAFLPRSKCLLISCSDFGAQEYKVSHCFLIYLPWSDGTKYHYLSFSECWALSQLFHSPLSLSSGGSLVLRFLP